MSSPLFKAKAIYFLFYAAGAALGPFLPIFYKSLGFPAGQIGLLLSITPLLALGGAPFWGGVADASRRHRLVLLGTMSAAMLAVAALSQMCVFWLLALCAAVYAFFSSPIIPLIDNTVLGILASPEGRCADYGKQRMWGAVGWGLAAPLAGWLAGRLGQIWPFVVYLAAMAGVLLVGARIPMRVELRGHSYWSGMRLLLSDRRWFLFLAVILLCGVGSAVISNYLFLDMADLGASQATMGLSLSVATLGEMPVLFFSGWMLRKWGSRGLLVIGMAAYVVRAMGLSLAAVPWQALALQGLHGLTFSAVWVAGVSYASELAPKGLGATAQGLMGSVYFGIGGISGSLLGGVVFEHFGGWMLFRGSALMVLAGLVLFLAAERRLRVRPAVQAPPGG